MADTEVSDEVPSIDTPVSGSRGLREAEVVPQYVVEKVDVDYAKELERFRQRGLFVDGVRKEALSKTRAHHWLARKQKNGQTTFSLMAPGAERIKTICPIGFINLRRREEGWTKEGGAGYSIYYHAEVYLANPSMGTLPVVGSCSSDDLFFSTEHVELPYSEENPNPEHRAYLESGEGRLSADKKTLYVQRQIPSTEVDKSNIEKSSLSNLVVNGVTRVLGIRNISAEELADAGILVEKIGGFEYGSGRAASGKLAPAEEQKRDEIRAWLMEMAEGDEKSALSSLKTRTAFKSNEPGGRDYPGCESWERLTPKQIAMHHEKVKADYMAWREGSPGAAPQQQPPKAQAPDKPGQRATGKAPAKGGAQQEGQRDLI